MSNNRNMYKKPYKNHYRKQETRVPKRTSKGIIALTSKALGFVTVPGFTEDIQVEPPFLNTALHGDEVEISLFPKGERNWWSGEVIRILTRAKMEFVGTVDKEGDLSFVVPDDNKMYTDILLPALQSKKLQQDTKVLVAIKKWSDPKKNPEGVVLKVIGKKGLHNTQL